MIFGIQVVSIATLQSTAYFCNVVFFFEIIVEMDSICGGRFQKGPLWTPKASSMQRKPLISKNVVPYVWEAAAGAFILKIMFSGTWGHEHFEEITLLLTFNQILAHS